MSLSQEEKEQVAVLLGWEWAFIANGSTIYRHSVTDERTSWWPVTLEALMEYAKGKGCDVYGIEWQADYERHEAYVCPDRNGSAYHAEDHDPLVAMVRALLKAEEAAK